MTRTLLAIALVLGSLRAAADPHAALDADVRARWSSDAFAVVTLDVPPAGSEAFSVVVERAGRVETLELQRHSLRAPIFRLRAFADGTTREVAPPPASTVKGGLRGDPGAVVAGTLTPAGLSVRVFPSEGASWTVRPLSTVVPGAPRSEHLVLEGGDWPASRACGVADAPGESTSSEPGAGADAGAPHAMSAEPLGEERLPSDPRERGPSPAWCGATGMKLAQIAFDVDQVYYRNHGSDIAAVTANVEGLLAEVDAFYARDVLITYELTDIIVRTTDFYLPEPTIGSLLDLFQQEWNANQRGVVRDIAHLMTGQPAPGLAGLAYVGVTCNLDWCYGWSVDSAGVLGHELGHNWSSGHCHDVSPCNAMCGACLYHGPNTKDIIMRFRDSRTCLDDVPAYGAPVPPYAHQDALALSRDEAVARAPVPADVLANDHDANCDDLRIASFDARSERGGTVSLDAGGGPGGRDRLLYAPPCMSFAGTDRFSYVLDDGAGGSASATVSVDIGDPGLVALWPLDDGAGSVAADATGWARDGAVQGAPAWTTGRSGGALELNGVDQHVTVPAMNLPGLPVTLTAWVRRSGALASFAGIAYSRGGSTTAGLHVGDGNDLRYTWSDDPATWGRSSGLVLPDGAWAFVALVVQADRATIWLDDGSSWRSWENALPHVPQRFDADTQLGWDPAAAARHFAGALDDVRAYDGALDEATLLAIRDASSPAEAPVPGDGAFTSDPAQILSWRSPAGVTEHDVYFGTDLDAVRRATPASREHQGRVTGAAFDPPGLLAEGFTYAWRVDDVVGGTPVPGDTWLFTLRGRAPRLLHHWPLDEAAGATAGDGVTGTPAGLLNGAAWGAGALDGAVDFDGVDDIVQAPLPGTTLSEGTITAWVRTRGAPAPWAGLVFTRGGGTATGLGFRDTAELGYHWGDAYWWWGSGLVVPLDTWIFVALSVEAGSATLWVEDGTGWRSATNAAGHGPVPWTGELVIGRDPAGAARSFAGTIDDVRVFDRALTGDEIREVRDRPGRAWNPVPFEGVALASPPSALGWVAGAGATSHELYVGDDELAVRGAGPSDAEYRGRLASTTWAPPPQLLLNGRTWYWRVDESSAAGTTQGTVWRFLLTGDVGDTLRVTKSPLAVPRLSWSEPGGSEGFEVLRCAPPPRGACVPVSAAAVGRATTTWDDPAATESVVWYQVSARPCLP